jgi:hypothetical protein
MQLELRKIFSWAAHLIENTNHKITHYLCIYDIQESIHKSYTPCLTLSYTVLMNPKTYTKLSGVLYSTVPTMTFSSSLR